MAHTVSEAFAMSVNPQYVREQQSRIEQLEEENRQLKELLMPDEFEGLEYGLTKTESLLFARLKRYELATKETLLQVVEAVNRTEQDIKSIDVWICYLRKKLRHSPYVITTVWGRGYKLEKIDE